jgi:hypothetical protein
VTSARVEHFEAIDLPIIPKQEAVAEPPTVFATPPVTA